jgi:two-component system copper resistance phosphate regulon response regulator CusR
MAEDECAMQNILIVEDDLTFAGAAEAHLRRAGFAVEVAIDALAALDMVETRRFDMLVVGIGMPSGKLSGVNFARMVRWRQPRSQVIFVASHPELAAAVPRFSGKVFVKPLELDDIVSEIRSQLVG